MFKRQTVQMLGVKTCLKDKQYKCWELKHVEKTNSTNVVSKTC